MMQFLASGTATPAARLIAYARLSRAVVPESERHGLRGLGESYSDVILRLVGAMAPLTETRAMPSPSGLPQWRRPPTAAVRQAVSE